MKILLAVSGGIDSMYMAEKAQELFPCASFAVAHCNFCLRGEESDGDEEFVRKWAEAHGTECFCKHFDTAGHSAANGISIEMAARELRYGWFSELCSKHGFDALAVAHNANDNAETLILNLLRGTGSRGLRGMSADTIISSPHLHIIRPLLQTTREEIRSWMVGNGKEWREDRTNAESGYKRNKVRNCAFPVFCEINPSFVKTLNEDMRRFAQVGQIADDYFRGSGLDPECVDIAGLVGFKHWRYLLFRLTEGKLNADELESLCAAIESGRPLDGKRFGPLVVGGGKLLPADADAPGFSVEMVERSCISDLHQPHGTLLIDADKVELPLQTRSWQDGDWMIPLGMKGRKKLSDMFGDLGYTLPQKKAALLIPHPDRNGRIAAIIGERIDDSVKVSGSTENILIVHQVFRKGQV